MNVDPPPSTGPSGLLSKSALLRRLEIQINRRLDGIVTGDHVAAASGPGSERAGARVYEPGDDARRIDWSLSARSLETYVRTTDADRELQTWVVVDRSASMDFGTATREKREVALAAVAAFGVVSLRSGNRLGVVVAGGERLQCQPPRPSRAGLLAALSVVYDTPRRDQPPALGAGLADGLRWVDRAQRRRGQVVVVSDFLDRSDWARRLRRLTLRHHVVAAHVTDPREMSLAPVGMLVLADTETGRTLHLQTNSRRLRERYADAAVARQAAIKADVVGAGAAYVHLSTDRDWVLDLTRFIAARPTRPAQRGPVLRGPVLCGPVLR